MEKNQKLLVFSFLLLSIISLSYAALEFREYYKIPSEINGNINGVVDNSTTFYNTINKKLNTEFNVPIKITRDLAADLSKEDPHTTELELKLNNSIQNHPRIFGVGVAYEPGMYQYLDELNDTSHNTSDPDLIGLYSPTYSRRNGEPELFQVSYNYTRPCINVTDPHTE